METIILNNDNLRDEDVQKYGNKARALLLMGDKLLVSEYGGVILFPGGSIDRGESQWDAIVRELREETGIIYNPGDLENFFLLKHYQANYPTRDEELLHRLMITRYFIGEFKGYDLSNMKRSQKEIADHFDLRLMTPNDILDYESDNPRKRFFDEENKEVIRMLKMRGV